MRLLKCITFMLLHWIRLLKYITFMLLQWIRLLKYITFKLLHWIRLLKCFMLLHWICLLKCITFILLHIGTFLVYTYIGYICQWYRKHFSPFPSITDMRNTNEMIEHLLLARILICLNLTWVLPEQCKLTRQSDKFITSRYY